VAGIAGWGAYIPTHRLERRRLGEVWDTPAIPGERAVCGGDEDSLTMGVAAALACVGDAPAEDLDAVFFASTTPPYAEKHAAATIAAVLDRRDVATADITGSLRAGTQALRAALDAVSSGSARRALVVAADNRPAEPATAMEQLFGDGAAAVLVTADAPVEVIGVASMVEEITGQWRRPEDRFVRSFEPKLETDYGYVRPVSAVVTEALARAGVEAEKARLVAGAPDPRTLLNAARTIGVADSKDALFLGVGNLGAAHVLVALAHALDGASAGDVIAAAAHGEGADAVVLRVGDVSRPAATVADVIASKRMLHSYEEYLRFRRLLPWDDANPRSSTVAYWRDRRQALRLEGVRCTACGTVQFPANRACVECSALDRMEPYPLSRKGAIFTFTLDHLVGGEYLETPVPRVVVDLDGGGRIFLEMTDCDPAEVRTGMPVEMTFRRIHDGGGFHNYYWKARPPRLPATGR
jgi:3-hydroxy-3-methylglutaryl CoA synthase